MLTGCLRSFFGKDEGHAHADETFEGRMVADGSLRQRAIAFSFPVRANTPEFRVDAEVFATRSFAEVNMDTSLIPSFQTTANRPLNELHCEMVSAKRAISGDSLCSGMVGMSS